MNGRRCLFAAALALSPAVAAAAPPTAAPERQGFSRIAPILPTLTLSGVTSGKGAIEGGADIIKGLSEDWDLSIAPSASVASDGGTASLLSYGTDNAATWNPKWQLKVVASFIDLGADTSLEATKGGTAGQIRAAAYARCVAACDDVGPDNDKPFCDGLSQRRRENALASTAQACISHTGSGADCTAIEPFVADVEKRASARITKRAIDCAAEPTTCNDIRREALIDTATQTVKDCSDAKPLCKWLGDRVAKGDISGGMASDMDPADFCPAGKRMLSEKFDIPLRDDRGRFPQRTISVGFGYGANLYKYLEGPRDGTLKTSSATKSSITAGASFTYVQPKGGSVTLELPVLFTSSWAESSTSAKWCATVGQVPRDAPSVGSDPAQSCQEQPYGAPTQTSEIWAAALLGAVDKRDGLWRISLGPTFAYQIEGKNKNQYRVGLQAPVHVNLASFSKEYTGSYKLLARVVPAVEISREGDVTGVQGGVAVQLLGARNLFGRALDWP